MELCAAAFLTAGIARAPFWKLVVVADVHRATRWLGLAGLMALTAMLAISVWRWHRRVRKERLDQEPAEGHSPPPREHWTASVPAKQTFRS